MRVGRRKDVFLFTKSLEAIHRWPFLLSIVSVDALRRKDITPSGSQPPVNYEEAAGLNRKRWHVPHGIAICRSLLSSTVSDSPLQPKHARRRLLSRAADADD